MMSNNQEKEEGGIFTGIDVGGTNTDIVTVNDEVWAEKIPNQAGLPAILARIPPFGRVTVSTSQVLNRVITGPPEEVCTVVIPGPGLVYGAMVPGAVNHRGDVTEPLGHLKLREYLTHNNTGPIAICGKFSLRNSALEEEAGRLAAEIHPGRRVALSHVIGTGSLPARISATTWNARVIATAGEIIRAFSGVRDDLLYFRGDGGLSSARGVGENPLLLFHSSPAAAATGALYASGLQEGLVIDIGGTSTDFIPLEDGKPLVAPLSPGGNPLPIMAVVSTSLPYGGDSLLAGTALLPQREGPPLAFGGPLPTLTDALNQRGEEIGESTLSHRVCREEAEVVVSEFTRAVAEAATKYSPPTLIGAGFLSPFLLPEIARQAGIPWSLPPHAASLNALGVAVSRVSIVYHIRADSERKRFVVDGKHLDYNGRWEGEALLSHAADLIRHDAALLGAPAGDRDAVITRITDSWDIIRSGRRTGTIWDIEAAIPPGISVEAP